MIRIIRWAFACAVVSCLTACSHQEIYAEFRIRGLPNDVEFLAFTREPSIEACHRKAREVLRRVFRNCKSCRIPEPVCHTRMPKRYARLWDNRPIQATYLALETDDSDFTDGRLVIFGVPSTAMARACQSLISLIRKEYPGTIECIRGKIG